MTLKTLFSLGLVLYPTMASGVESMTIEETVRAAAAIFVGRITGMESRWQDVSRRTIVTGYTIQVETSLLPAKEISPGSRLVLTFWGGTLGNERQQIAGLHLPENGRRYLMMLRSDWESPGFTPAVGLMNGIFRILEAPGGSQPVVADAEGMPLVEGPDGRILRASELNEISRRGPPVTLEAFLGWLGANLKRLKEN